MSCFPHRWSITTPENFTDGTNPADTYLKHTLFACVVTLILNAWLVSCVCCSIDEDGAGWGRPTSQVMTTEAEPSTASATASSSVVQVDSDGGRSTARTSCASPPLRQRASPNEQQPEGERRTPPQHRQQRGQEGGEEQGRGPVEQHAAHEDAGALPDRQDGGRGHVREGQDRAA